MSYSRIGLGGGCRSRSSCSAALAAAAQERVIAKVNGKTITEADMRLAEAEIGSDLGSLPEATKRRCWWSS